MYVLLRRRGLRGLGDTWEDMVAGAYQDIKSWCPVGSSCGCTAVGVQNYGQEACDEASRRWVGTMIPGQPIYVPNSAPAFTLSPTLPHTADLIAHPPPLPAPTVTQNQQQPPPTVPADGGFHIPAVVTSDSFLHGVPNWALLGGGLVLYLVMRRS